MRWLKPDPKVLIQFISLLTNKEHFCIIMILQNLNLTHFLNVIMLYYKFNIKYIISQYYIKKINNFLKNII